MAKGLLGEMELVKLLRLMPTMPAIKSTHKRRRGFEQDYFRHHRALGVKLRGKYRA